MNIRQFISHLRLTSGRYPKEIFEETNKAYTFINPYSYHIYRKNQTLYDSLDGYFADGFFLCFLVRLFWRVKIQRLSFDMGSMARTLFDRINAEDTGVKICFVGARASEIENTVANIRESYPNIVVPYFRDGYFINDDDRKKCIEKIISSEAEYAVVGMGAPIQEHFAIELKESGYKGVVFTCGGFLHQTANGMNYYPEWINRYNLRAFYRLYREKGLFHRLYNVLIQFPALFVIDTIMTKLQFKKK